MRGGDCLKASVEIMSEKNCIKWHGEMDRWEDRKLGQSGYIWQACLSQGPPEQL